MQKFKLLIFLSIIIPLSPAIYAQKNVKIASPTNIKSISFKPKKLNSYAPIIKLGETMQLSFDDLEGDMKMYSYKIEHCDYDWNISNLSTTEYFPFL